MSLKGISEKRKIQMSEKLETYQNEYRCYQLLYEINQIELNRILHRINTLETIQTKSVRLVTEMKTKYSNTIYCQSN
jgi:uncharacterized protein YlbG (UPF0298 family)